MKKIGLTMRIDYSNNVNEYRDAIDQRWYFFSKRCNFMPVLLPNFEFNSEYIEELSGLIFTGGDTLKVMGGNAKERDDFETILIAYAERNNIPLFGVCRGMQMIQNYYGIKLHQVPNHVGVRHSVCFDKQNEILDVNSFHNFAALESIDDIIIDAKSEDGVIEAIHHKNHLIRGIMWHPEREKNFSQFDIDLFMEHFHL